MTAPMVVAQWINAQYLFSTLDNVSFGAGSKVTQNITGKLGVMQGNASDLMHGLPQQTPEMAVADLCAALELGAPHVSWYQLTLEPNTVFHARPPDDLPDDDTLHAIQDAGAERLQGGGFEQYEVSAWARGGRRCRHNLNYWLFGDYLAVGAGAHGKLSESRRIVRYRKAANPLQYMNEIEAGAGGVDRLHERVGEADGCGDISCIEIFAYLALIGVHLKDPSDSLFASSCFPTLVLTRSGSKGYRFRDSQPRGCCLTSLLYP